MRTLVLLASFLLFLGCELVQLQETSTKPHKCYTGMIGYKMNETECDGNICLTMQLSELEGEHKCPKKIVGWPNAHNSCRMEMCSFLSYHGPATLIRKIGTTECAFSYNEPDPKRASKPNWVFCCCRGSLCNAPPRYFNREKCPAKEKLRNRSLWEEVPYEKEEDYGSEFETIYQPGAPSWKDGVKEIGSEMGHEKEDYKCMDVPNEHRTGCENEQKKQIQVKNVKDEEGDYWAEYLSKWEADVAKKGKEDATINKEKFKKEWEEFEVIRTYVVPPKEGETGERKIYFIRQNTNSSKESEK